MRLQNKLRVTGRRKNSAGSTQYPLDLTVLSERTASWHSDLVDRHSVVVHGYSKSDGRFAVAEFDRNTGAVLDSRIILDEPTLYTSINDHFMVVPHLIRNGTHAGKLWVITLPHGPGTSGEGSRRFYCRYSLTGRTANLVPAGTTQDYLLASQVHNYGQIQERSDGRLCLLTINDGSSPQSGRLLYTDNPAVIPTLCRPIFDMTTIPAGGDPQIYANAVPGPSADTMRVYLFLHPSVPDAPIKTCLLNLADGTCRVGGVAQGSGSIFDASGSTMLTYGNAPAINSPTGFTRVHDVCQYGLYQYGHAIALTQGAINSNLDEPSHIVRWCDPDDNVEDAANWQQVNIGAANRARSWDNGGNRRYNSDIRFLPPRGSESIRVWIVAHQSGNYRIEIWGGESPNAMVMLDATPWSSKRLTRLFTNPKGDIDSLLGFGYGILTYSSFVDFVPSVPETILTSIDAVSSSSLEGTPNVGNIFSSATPSVFSTTSSFPNPTISYKWWISDDDQGANSNMIDGATSQNYTPVISDVGKHLQRQDIAKNSAGTVSTFSNWSLAVQNQTLWDMADLPFGLQYEIFDPSTGVVLDGGQIAEITGEDGSVYSQSNAINRPDYVSMPPHINFSPVNFLSGDSKVNDLFRNRGLFYNLLIARPTILNGTNRHWRHCSTGASTSTTRFLLRSGTTNAWQLTVRRLDGDSASTIIGAIAEVDKDVIVEGLAKFSASGSTARLFINTVTQPNPLSEPTSGTTSSDTASQLDRIGSDGTGTTNVAGRLYLDVRVYGSAGAMLTVSDQQKIQGWAAHKYGFVNLLPSDHPYKLSAPTK
jgi:hypothetical protein